MSDYTQATSFGPKDSLPTGDAGKKIKGSEFDVEFGAISDSIKTKANKISGATNDNLVAMDANGDIKDAGKTLNETLSAARIVGEIIQYGGSSAPSGWLLCDGSAVSRSTYSSLFTAIGTTFGSGNGSTTFNVPDLRGRVGVGAGSGTGLTARTLGGSGGEENHTLTSGEIPDHQHRMFANGAASSRGINGYPDDYVYHRGDSSDNDAYWMEGAGTTTPTLGKSGNMTTTGGGAHNNMQPWLAVNYLIKT